jgi:hypothetical protein
MGIPALQVVEMEQVLQAQQVGIPILVPPDTVEAKKKRNDFLFVTDIFLARTIFLYKLAR